LSGLSAPGFCEGEITGAKEHLFLHLPLDGSVIDRQRVLADRFGRDDTYDLAGLDTVDDRILPDILQSQHG